jgi:hypothetical protein
VPTCGLVDLGGPAWCDHHFESIPVTGGARHRDGSGELLEVLGRRVVVGHLVDDDGLV